MLRVVLVLVGREERGVLSSERGLLVLLSLERAGEVERRRDEGGR
jgi:hypothetical protein